MKTPSLKWLTLQAAAKYIGVSTVTLLNWEAAGSIRIANVIQAGASRGRRFIDREELDRYISGGYGVPPVKLAMNTQTKPS